VANGANASSQLLRRFTIYATCVFGLQNYNLTPNPDTIDTSLIM